MKEAISEAFEIKEKYKGLLEFNKFMKAFKEKDKVIAVPFIIGVSERDLYLDCEHLAFDRLTDIKEDTYFCSLDEHKYQFAQTGSKIISCKGCSLYNNHKGEVQNENRNNSRTKKKSRK